MRSYIFLIVVLLVCNSLVYTQNTQWKHTFGGKKIEKGLDIISTYNGKVAIIGQTDDTPKRGIDAYFLLLDEHGQKQREKVFGFEKEDQLKSIHETKDNGFLLSGFSQSGNSKKEEAWLVKLNQEGDTIWQRRVGGPHNDSFHDAIQTMDGGIAAVGSIGSSEGRSMWFYRAYEDGQQRWQKTFGSGSFNEARAIVETKEGNFAIAGVTSKGKGKRNIWLFILDADGRPLHHRIFGSRQWEEVYDLVELREGGFALAGFAKTTKENKGKGLKDMWIIKTSPEGEMIWESTFGGRHNDSAFGITETTDGGLVAVGYTFSHIMGANTSKAMIIKCNSDGKLDWEGEAMGGKANDEMVAVNLTPEGNLVMVGTTASKSENAQKEDIWVSKVQIDTKINTLIPSNLVITTAVLSDNGDGFLEEGESAYLEISIENKGNSDALDINLILQESSNYEQLVYDQVRRLGFLRAGQSKKVFVPIQALEGIALGDADFQIFCTDASRTRTDVFNLKVPVKPLEVPSNYLKIVWMDPKPVKKDFQKKVKTERISIKVKARSDKPLKRRHFTIYLNGEPYKVGQKAGEASLRQKSKTKEVYDFEYQNFVDLQVGLNNIQVEVNNESKMEKSPVFEIEYSNKPNLHVLAIGIEHDDLNYTIKDAQDFVSSFQEQEGKLFDNIHLTTLISGIKTKAGLFQTEGQIIKNAFLNLEENYQYTIYDRDLLIVFMSSHGKTINNRFKIVPTDFGMMGESVLIDYQEDILKPLESIFCHKLLLIDACHSGSYDTEVVGSSLEDSRAQALQELNDMLQTTNTLASCQANESSWEDVNWENGAFTEALIGAFNNESYKDASGSFQVSTDDSIITVNELFNYLSRRVPQMIMDVGKQGTQHPFLSKSQLERVGNLPVFEVK